MKRLAAFFSTLLVGLIIAGFTYYLGLNKPDVRYTLSQGIPLSFSSGNSRDYENVQQIVVKNVGNTTARNIVIKINAEISNYQAIKHIASDKVDVYIDQEPAEFIYSELPPQADYKIIFVSGNSVTVSDVIVSHSTGKAIDALSASSNSEAYLVTGLYILFFFGYLMVILKMIRDIFISKWEMDLNHKRIDQIVSGNKPFFFTNKDWVTRHEEIIKNKLNSYNFKNKVYQLSSYHFLNLEKPAHLPDADWQELTDIAISKVKGEIFGASDRYDDAANFEVFSLQRPHRFPIDEWNLLQGNANKKFIEKKVNRIYTKEDALEYVKSPKPEVVEVSTWDTIRKSAIDYLFHQVITEISIDPNTAMKQNDISIFDPMRQEKLREHVRLMNRYTEMNKYIKIFLNMEKIQSPKPDCFTDWEWNRIVEFQDLILELSTIDEQTTYLDQKLLEVSDKTNELVSEEKELIEKIEKITKQLDFIDRLLEDPQIINRVESYDTTFSNGNWDNLRKLAGILLVK